VQDKVYAYKVVNGKSKATIIGVFEINDGKEYIVEEGLIPGDTIITEGIGVLRNNIPVKLKNVVSQKDEE
jgi:membrane fusion protein (multidrug efflux system)